MEKIKEKFIENIKHSFVEDYDNMKATIEYINYQIKTFDLDIFNYNDFCKTFLVEIEKLIENTSDENYYSLNIKKESITIFYNMVITKIKNDNDYNENSLIIEQTIKKYFGLK